MSKWHYLFTALIATPAAAADPLTFEGVAHTGADTRPVRVRFICSANEGRDLTGVLSAELEVPAFETVSAFDFIPFEGPDAHAGALSTLRGEGARTKATDQFTASGSIEQGEPSDSFALEVTASRRESGPLRKLAAVLRPLLDGPSVLSWRQGNVKPGGMAIEATLDLTKAQTDELRTMLGPCLNGR
jgi:hypothetical protein